MIKAEDVFNPRDFESIRLSVHFKNNTTHTEVADAKKAQFVEIGDKWIVLELPSKSCNSKHSVMVDIKKATKDPKKKEQPLLSVTGKVHTCEDLGDGRSRVVIECVQFDEKSWSDFLALYSNRQAEIEKFFAAVKG